MSENKENRQGPPTQEGKQHKGTWQWLTCSGSRIPSSQGQDVLEHDRREVVKTDQDLISSTRKGCGSQLSWPWSTGDVITVSSSAVGSQLW